MDKNTSNIKITHVLNINDICRLCGDIHTNLDTIFEHDLKEKIEKFIPIKVRKSDGFPSKICKLCKSKLNTMYEFKSLAIYVDKKLHAILNKEHYLLDVKNTFDAEYLLKTSNENNNILTYGLIGNAEHTTEDRDNNHVQHVIKFKTANNDAKIDKNNTDCIETDSQIINSCVPSQNKNAKEISNIDPTGNNNYFKLHENNKPTEDITKVDIKQISNQKCTLKIQDTKNGENLIKENTNQESEKPLEGRWKTIKDVDSVSCMKCGKIVKRATYKNHMKTHTRVYDKKCNICGALLLTNSQLWYHKKTRHREKQYTSCDKCGKLFQHNSHFHDHYRNVHLKIKKHKCHICNSSFGRRDTLKRHMQTHSGARPHICHICGRGLCSTFSLKHHLRQHTNDAPYKCSDCDKSFKQKVTLQLHFKRQHLGVTPEQEKFAKLDESK